MKLTAQSAHDLLPGGRLKDHVVKGLELRSSGVSKSWLFYYRAPDGTQRRPKLGAFPGIGIEAARTIAKDWLLRIARGEDPSAERQALRGAPTVADLAELYLVEHARRRKAKQSIQQDERNIRLHILPVLGGLRVSEVRLRDINQALDRLEGAALSNRVRALLHVMFELAAHADYAWRLKATNPVSDVPKRVEDPRSRKVELHEFAELARELDRLAARYPRQVAAIRVSLLAGTRITELVGAKRSELNGNVLTRLEHKSRRKGQARRIYLSHEALAIIRELPDDGSGYLFGYGMKRHGWPRGEHLSRHNIFDVWNLARKAVGLTDLRPQDLRRTFASVAGSLGIGLDPVGQLFGHSDPKTTRRYQWLFDDAATANAQATSTKIGELMRPTEKGGHNVRN